MKAIISAIKRMEIHDGDGLRTTVFFKGCPLRCIWCHNPESISFEPQVAKFENKCIGCGLCQNKRDENAARNCPADALTLFGKEYDVDALLDTVMEDELFFKNGNGGVTLSGGECLSQADFVIELAKRLYERGISVDIDTCGQAPKSVFEAILPYTDTFLYDVKAADSELHKRLTGRDNTLIISNLKFLSQMGAKIEIRYPLVKGYNDTQADEIGKLLKDIPGIKKIKVLKYHSLASSRYDALNMKNTLPDTVTTSEDVDKAVSILRAHGLNAINGEKED